MAQDRTPANGFLEAARWYISKGLPVFPLIARTKEPATKHGFKDASTDEKRIFAWWQRWPNANLGIPTGARSGIDVVDVDPRNGGEESLHRLEAEHGRLPDTARAVTGGGGKHYVFRDPGEICRCATLALGVDFKASGGYICVAPSVHPNGNEYFWDGENAREELLDCAPLPAWILAMLPGASLPAAAPKPTGPIVKGQRKTYLAQCAGRLRWAGLEEEAIRVHLHEINESICQPPVEKIKVDRIAHSIARYARGTIDLGAGELIGSPPESDPPSNTGKVLPDEPPPPPAETPTATLAEPIPAAAPPAPQVLPLPSVTEAKAAVPPGAAAPSKTEQATSPNGSAGPSRARILEWVGQQIGLEITDIRKFMGDQATWQILLADGGLLEFSSTAGFLDQKQMRTEIAARTSRLLRRFNNNAWDKIMQHVLSIATEVPASPEDSLAAEVALALDEYLATSTFLAVLEEEALFNQNGPCYWRGQVAITLYGLRAFLNRKAPHLMLNRNQLTSTLRALGAEHEKTSGWDLRKWRWLLPRARFAPERYADKQKLSASSQAAVN